MLAAVLIFVVRVVAAVVVAVCLQSKIHLVGA